jgi:hypothetical protein
MGKTAIGIAGAAAFLMALAVLGTARLRAHDDDRSDSRIRQGFRIAPVRLDLRGKNPALVGIGSYLVNAAGSCNDCHSCPSYEPGHNPYGPPFGPPGGGDGKVNAKNYLAGGVPFDPPGILSANLTPAKDNGRPEGHTFQEFKTLIRTGHDADEGNRILQVMPWPVLRHLTDEDLRAIYEYLRAIPHADPGQCVAPGQ